MTYLVRGLVTCLLAFGLWGGTPSWGDQHGGEKVNINTADKAALEALPGIGPAKADAIIEYRQKTGEFKTVSDLEKVPGIGEKTVEQLKDKVTVGDQITTGQ
ncbi:MAG: ComEA family DNA-binding protein [Thermodesulfobacteriota bacterium]|jgi:competence protein ComEA